ncbi:MAG: hypothetical protein KGL39_25690 [Patescibacteria group bacterium]|nr:hypothetical protein [Patescibacteria group bacterium]
MLFADTDGGTPWWLTLVLSVLSAVAGGAGGGGIVAKWMDYRRQRERDAISDYQKLLDTAEAAREKLDQSREKLLADSSATIAENLRLKDQLAKAHEELVCIKGKPYFN